MGQVVIEGYIESIAEHIVTGWVYDPIDPLYHLPVMARLGAEQLGSTIARTSRADLVSAGIGEGDHGFELTFEQPIAPDALASVEVWAGEGDEAIRLMSLPASNQSKADHASNIDIPACDPTQFPVFVLGPARSGTSALALALLKTQYYQGFGEGQLLPLAHELLGTVDQFYGRHAKSASQGDTLLRSVTRETFQRMIRRGFVQLIRATHPGGRWIDKTPTAGMIRAAPLMQEIWPNARFVFLKRRVIENTLSRRRKFPNEPLENCFRDWVHVLSVWRTVRNTLGEAAIEVDQLDMARDAASVAGRISRFLNLPDGPAAEFKAALLTDHPEKTSPDVGRIETLESLNLTGAEQEMLMRECGPIMEAYGYSFNRTYYAADDPLAAVM